MQTQRKCYHNFDLKSPSLHSGLMHTSLLVSHLNGLGTDRVRFRGVMNGEILLEYKDSE